MNAALRFLVVTLLGSAVAPLLAHAADASPLVGVYYYPWYGIGEKPPGEWRNVFRQRLNPAEAPRAGLYSSDEPEVIKEHIAQSERGGVDFWAVSWWGPGSPTDRNFHDAILTHPDAAKLKYAVLYESTGRLGDPDAPHYDRWASDLAYLKEHYFSQPQYLHIDGRPVLFVYLTRVYFRDRGREALAALRRDFKDVYLIGDDVFGGEYRPEWAKQFDAVTIYDVYGQSAGPHGATHKAVAALAANYAHAREVAQSVGVGFVPTVAPGYNDTVIRRGHPGAARYFTDVPDSQEGDFFQAAIREAALPNLDPKCSSMMMVTSFNEWYEDSQIEATAGTAAATTKDSSASDHQYTAGARYEDYGYRYLDLLRETVDGVKRSNH